jgi:hypothetical protein
VVRWGEEAGHFPEADCIREFTEVVMAIGNGPVVHGVNEIEGRMPCYQFEPIPPGLSHVRSLSPSKAI